MHGDELGAIGEGAFDLHVGEHLGDALLHLGAAEQLAPDVHELGDGVARADELEDLRGDERDGLGIVKPQSACQALLRQKPRVVEEELVDVARGEVHRSDGVCRSASSLSRAHAG